MMESLKPLVLVFIAVSFFRCSGSSNPSIVADDAGGPDSCEMRTTDGPDCMPDCVEKECGTDGCGGTCGACPTGTECNDVGRCSGMDCSSSKDCPGALICNKETSECVVCTEDADCSGESFCGADHECHERIPCDSDVDCKPLGLVCDKEGSLCVECIDNADCLVVEYCFESLCFPDECSAEDTWCEDNTVWACVPDGSMSAIGEECGDSAFCEGGFCLPYLCQPAATWCDGNEAKTCDESGKSVASVEDCGLTGLHCFEGSCIDTECLPLSKFCADATTTALCAADGLTYEIYACPLEHFCADGECQAWLCTPTETFCDGPLAKLCDALGSSVASEQDCSLDGQVCIGGKCTDDQCQPDCQGKDCGSDGCGGLCGDCDEGQTCIQGACPPPGQACDDDNDIAWDGCTEGTITEAGTNAWTVGNQMHPAVAGGPAGSYAVAWTSDGQDGSGSGVFGRVVVSWAQSMSPEIQLNIYTEDDQQDPDISAAADGGVFTAVWTSQGQDGDAAGVFGINFGESGPIGDEFQVNSNESASQANPAIKAHPGGGVVIVWESQLQDGDETGVFGTVLEASGQPVAAEFQANSHSAGKQRTPDVAATSTDKLVVVWNGAGETSDNAIHGRLFDTQANPVAEQFQVSSGEAAIEHRASVDALKGGGFVVVWSTAMPNGVRGRLYGEDGVPLGPEFLLTSQPKSDLAVVAGLTEAGFVTAWAGKGPEDADGIHAQVFSAAGEPAGTLLHVNTYSNGPQLNVAISTTAGGFVAAWQSFGQNPDGSTGVFVQRFDSAGQKMYF